MVSAMWDTSALKLRNIFEEEFGGYLEKRLRESIQLNRPTKRYLKLATRSDIDLKFHKVGKKESNGSSLVKYIIEFDTTAILVKGYIRPWNNPEWNCKAPYNSNQNVDTRSLYKEKIIVRDNVKDLFSAALTKLDLSVRLNKFDQNVHAKYRLNEDFLQPLGRTLRHSCEFPVMHSRLVQRESELYEEFLSYDLPKRQMTTMDIQFKTVKVQSFQQYKIQYIQTLTREKTSQEYTSSARLPHWQSNQIQNSSIKFLKLCCEDEDFHPLELYKLENPKADQFQRKAVYRSKPIKPKWRISDEIIKRLNWNPFKELNLPKNSELLESLRDVQVRCTSYALVFKRIPSSKIDLMVSKIPVSFRSVNAISYDQFDPKSKENVQESSQCIDSLANEETTDVDEVTNKRIMTSGKRSFINADLVSIIAAKRSKLKRLSISNGDVNPVATLNETVEQSTMSNVTFQLSDKSFHNAEEKVIIFNAEYIAKNYKLINFLHQNNFCVLEMDLGDHSDILLDASTCLILRNITSVYQKQVDSFPLLRAIQELKCKYKRVVIFLSYSERSLALDSNLAYKTQLLLNCLGGTTTHLVEETQLKLTATWISLYCGTNTPNEQQIYRMSLSKEVLQHFDINPIAIESILSLTSLEEFLSISYGKRALLYGKFLTEYQLAHIDDFVTMSWSE